jgi:hypothetical protein
LVVHRGSLLLGTKFPISWKGAPDGEPPMEMSQNALDSATWTNDSMARLAPENLKKEQSRRKA